MMDAHPAALCVVLSRKVDCDVGWRAAKLKITLKLAVAPSSLNTLLKNLVKFSVISVTDSDPQPFNRKYLINSKK